MPRSATRRLASVAVLVLLCVCLGWVIIGSTFGRAKTRGQEVTLRGAFNNFVQATPVCAILCPKPGARSA